MGSSAVEGRVFFPREGDTIAIEHEVHKIVELIEMGGYGAVFNIIRTKDNKPFAIKFEKNNAESQTLKMELYVLKELRKIKSKHFCTLVEFGAFRDHVFIVMQLVGKNLWDLRMEREEKKFSLGTSLKAAIQCLISIEQLHRLGYIHRGIEPKNFAIGREEEKEHHIIYMLDFGLCRRLQKKVCEEGCKNLSCQRKPRFTVPFRGYIRYASVDAMKLKEQSRKDDIECWLYMVVEWTSGGLPWEKYKADNRAKVLLMKEELRTEQHALGFFLFKCPTREFTMILEYVDKLRYWSLPDYRYIYKLIDHALRARNFKWEDPVDWDEGTPYMAPKEEPGDGYLPHEEKADKEANVEEVEVSKKDMEKTNDISDESSAE